MRSAIRYLLGFRFWTCLGRMPSALTLSKASTASIVLFSISSSCSCSLAIRSTTSQRCPPSMWRRSARSFRQPSFQAAAEGLGAARRRLRRHTQWPRCMVHGQQFRRKVRVQRHHAATAPPRGRQHWHGLPYAAPSSRMVWIQPYVRFRPARGSPPLPKPRRPVP